MGTRQDVDGVIPFGYGFGNRQKQYHKELSNLAQKYIEEVVYFAKPFSVVGRILGKPNTHRLIELYVRTSLLYGHSVFVSHTTF